MNFLKIGFLALLPALAGMACSKMNQNKKGFKADDMMIRMAEIEIDSAYVGEYIAILKEEAAASVRLEPGVICIYARHWKKHTHGGFYLMEERHL